MSQIKTRFIENLAVTDAKVATGLDAAKIGAGSVSNTEFGYLDGVTSAIQTQLGGMIPSSEKGAVNGVAELDGSGKVPVAQLPNSIMEFQGQWDASTNTPTLVDGTGNTGDVYRINVAGTQNLGSGSVAYIVSDWVMYSGAIWQKAANNDSAGANASLSNLVSTSVNADIIPDANNTRALGSSSVAWSKLWAYDFSGVGQTTISSGPGQFISLSPTTHTETASPIQMSVQTPLRFMDADSSNYVALRAPAVVASNVTWDLPAADGTAGQVLQTSGAGVLSFVTPAASGANTTLSNLGATSINANLVPDGDNTRVLGAGAAAWSSLVVYDIKDAGNITSMSSNSRNLQNALGNTKLDWSGNGLSISTVTNAHISLNPDGTGKVAINDASAGTAGHIFTSFDAFGRGTWVAQKISRRETFTLSAGDITNQFVTLALAPQANSVHFVVKGGSPTLEGAAHDFSVAGSQINFLNDLATGGATALIAGDIIQLSYVS